MTAEPAASRLDLDNPWPGLDSFAEADREYFHGRTHEAADLLARVRAEPLTIVFGRSGLGKTSLLNAGVFPLLREEDLLPVYIRLAYDTDTPLRDQVLIALSAECAAHAIEAPAPRRGETLWEYFHGGAEFWSARNRPVTPVLVFDQFEEIFTLGRGTPAVEARSAAFAAELGEIIENRVPERVKRDLDSDASADRRFDFRARNVKAVLSFREDFLADIEGLRQGIPSIVHNRFRLNPLAGEQAFDAVTKSGGRLVDKDVALRIIGLAGRGTPEPPTAAELARLEVDPALLSVLCSELNAKRRRAGLSALDAKLLQGAEREILSEFYERGVAGLDSRVRVFIEESLLTAGGFRNSCARDDALARPGVTAEALGTLVARRLVREDERFGARRLELTHDILIPVVRASRDARHAREAQVAALIRIRERQKGRRAKVFLVVFPAAIVSVVITAGVALWLVFHAFTDMTHAVEQRRVTLELTSELSRLTRSMSRLVRAFAATGDTHYLQEYFALTDYRTVMGGSGLRQYLKAEDGQAEGKSFPVRMKEAGASEEELKLLDNAIDTSDTQHKLQQISFAAMQGLYDPGKQEFVTGGEPHPQFALKTLYGPEYEKLTAALEGDVLRLAELADARTRATVQKETDELFVGILILGSGLGLLLVLTVAALVIIGGYRRNRRVDDDREGSRPMNPALNTRA